MISHRVKQHQMLRPQTRKRKSRAPSDPHDKTVSNNIQHEITEHQFPVVQQPALQSDPVMMANAPADEVAADNAAAPVVADEAVMPVEGQQQDEQNEQVRPLVDAHLYRIYATVPRQVPQFGLGEISYWVRLTAAAADEVALADQGLGTIADVLVRAITALLVEVTRPLQPRDLVQLVISNGPALDYPIIVGPVRPDILTVQYLLDEIMAVLNSNQQFLIGDELLIQATTIRPPVGGRNNSGQPLLENKWLHDALSIVHIRNTDQLCSARALVLALARFITGFYQQALINLQQQPLPATEEEMLSTPVASDWIQNNPVIAPMWSKQCYYANMSKRERPQREAALRLIQYVGLHEGPCGNAECRLVQDRLLTDLNVRLVVFSLRRHSGTMFNGPDNLANNIYLYHNQEHYHMVTSPKGFINCSYFCQLCLKPYEHRGAHRCAMTCFRCHQSDQAACTGPLQQCQKCLCWLAGQDCMMKHQQLKTCIKRRYCPKCAVFLGKPADIMNHKCDQTRCRLCQTMHKITEKHHCYMKCHVAKLPAGRIRPSVDADEEEIEDVELYNLMGSVMAEEGRQKATYRYVAWDVETAQKVVQESERVQLVVNCVAARMICSICRHLPLSEQCQGCGDERTVCYVGETAMDQFCNWLMNTDRGDPDDRVETICFAHNFKSFDSYPLLAYIFSKNLIPELIMSGCKVMGLKLPDQRLKFLDSINYMPMALRALPGAMGLSTSLAKGTFPHRFNKMEHLGKKFNCHPPASYYDPGSMKTAELLEFQQWHQKVRGKPFDFNKELRSYCKNDVEVLLRAVLAFREKFMTMTTDRSKAPEGVDPYINSMTLASACNLVYRQLFLRPETVGLIPSYGYNPKHKQSLEAMQWLYYLISKDQNQYGRIQHARNGGEVSIPWIGKVDGYFEDADSGEKYVFEYQVKGKWFIIYCYSEHVSNNNSWLIS